MKIIIIGGVAGGATTAARLRRIDETSEIIMIERGTQVSFANSGLPYYLGGVVSSKETLEIKSVEALASRYNLDIRIMTELVKLDPLNKTLTVKNLQTKEKYKETYDKLILTEGDLGKKPKFDQDNYFCLRTIEDFDKLKEFLDHQKPSNATIIGGGMLGLQLVENLSNLGLSINLLEASDQVLPNLDYEMAQIIHNHLVDNNVNIVYGNHLVKLDGNMLTLSNNTTLKSDLIINATGKKPSNKVAKNSGISLSETGSILVDKHLQTNIPDIYAIGDVIEDSSPLLDYHELMPLSGPALRQARIVADNILGDSLEYPKSIGTSVVKVFDYTAANVGFNEVQLSKNNLNFDTIHIHPNTIEGFYPGSSNLALKVLYNPKTEEILGAQAVGMNGVDKRIDVLATAMQGNIKVSALKDLELTYAAPYSSGKDPINMAGYVAHNKIKGLVKTISFDRVNDLVQLGEYILDIRDVEEFEMGTIQSSKNIPLPILRERLNELPKDKNIYVFCAQGMRGYVATRILLANGFNAFNIDGGYKTYSTVYETSKEVDSFEPIQVETIKGEKVMSEAKVVLKVDAAGLQCPGPIVKLYKSLEEINHGEALVIKATDPGFKTDVKKWAAKTGNQVLSIDSDKGVITAKIQKGISTSLNQAKENKIIEDKNGTTIVVFSQDLDKALAAFIIAQGAATMGKKVNLFFTFWGLNILRKAKKVKVRKTFMEKMFGWMMPRGANKLPISNMNMGGMGSKMIKSIMKKKNVDSLPIMIDNAKDLGVNIQACAMSMDIMGIKKEEMIDGIEVVGVATYLADTTDANHNLFI